MAEVRGGAEGQAGASPPAAERGLSARPLLRFAMEGDEPGLEEALEREEQEIRQMDRTYWCL